MFTWKTTTRSATNAIAGKTLWNERIGQGNEGMLNQPRHVAYHGKPKVSPVVIDRTMWLLAS